MYDLGFDALKFFKT